MVDSVKGSYSFMIASFCISLALELATVFGKSFSLFHFVSIVCTNIVPFSQTETVSYLVFNSTHSVKENSSDLILYGVANACCESGHITAPPFPSSAITFARGGRGRATFNVFVTDSGSVSNNAGRQPLWKRNVSSSARS